jgi:hypothetical protein
MLIVQVLVMEQQRLPQQVELRHIIILGQGLFQLLSHMWGKVQMQLPIYVPVVLPLPLQMQMVV